MKVLASVVHYHGLSQTQLCVESLKPMSDHVDPLVISSELIPEGALECPILYQDNRGYAAAQNKAYDLLAADGRYHYWWILNNDVVLTAQTLTEMIAIMGADQRLGAVAPTQETPQGIHPSGWRIQHTKYDYYTKVPVVPERSFDCVDVLTGPALLVRVQAALSAGRLDERYFHYFDDDDYSLRIRKSGWKLAVAACKVVHKHGGSLDAQSLEARYYTERNRILLMKKHFPNKVCVNWSVVKRAIALRSRMRGMTLEANAHLFGVIDGLLGRGGTIPWRLR